MFLSCIPPARQCFAFKMEFQNCSSHDPFCLKKFPRYETVGCFSPPLDYFLATILVICAVIGCPGNVLSAQFFAGKTRKDLVTRLYITICVVDSVSCIFNLPVAVSLFAGRRPLWFQYKALCILWESVSLLQTKLSIFLVLILSATRTIAIVKPFYTVRKWAVLVAVVGYPLLLISGLLFAVINSTTRERFRYSWDGVYCYYNYKYPWEHVVNAIQIGLPPILIFVSLVVSIIKLHYSTKVTAARQHSPASGGAKKEQGRFQASVTIAMFTGLFLFCNLPLFTNLIHNVASKYFDIAYPGFFFGSPFMFWYSWHIAKVQCMVWNAALNPVLYYCRMKRLRRWVNNFLSPSKVRADEFYMDTFTNQPQPVLQSDPDLVAPGFVAPRLSDRQDNLPPRMPLNLGPTGYMTAANPGEESDDDTVSRLTILLAELSGQCSDHSSRLVTKQPLFALTRGYFVTKVLLGEIFVECPLSLPYGVVGHTKGTSNMQF
eukprot:sb/3464185/